MIRWISSGLITAALFCALLFLQFPEIKSAHRQQTEANAAISNVTVIKKSRPVKKQTKAAPKPVEKQKPLDTPVPEKSAIPEKTEEAELPPEDAADTEDDSAAEAEDGAEDGESDAGDTAAANGIPDNAALSSYRAYVLGRIAAKKIYPAAARARGQEGTVELSVVLQPDGKVESVQVVASSASALLNEASIAAVRKAAPFKPLPDGLTALTLRFAMAYTLD